MQVWSKKVHFDLESTLSASFLFLVTNTIIWVSLFDYGGISHELTAVGGKPYFSNQRHFSIYCTLSKSRLDSTAYSG